MGTPQKNTDMLREAVGVFSDADSLQAAIDDLNEHGFIWNDISVLADDKTVEEKLGHIYKRVEDAADDPDTPRMAFIPKEAVSQMKAFAFSLPLYIVATTATGVVVASGGTMLATLMAAMVSVAAGGTIGSLLAELIDKKHAKYIQRQLDRGGLLLWISLHSSGQEKKAVKILGKHAAHDIHVHEIPLYS